MTLVVCSSIPVRVADPEANRALGVAAIERAAAMGADVVVLPELANSGYVLNGRPEALLCAEESGGASVEAWSEAAVRHGIVVVAGFCEKDQAGALYSSALLADRTGLRAVYRKAHLWNTEKDLFEAGAGLPPVIDTHAGRIGVLICYDLEFPEWVRDVALRGAELLCAPVAWPDGKRPTGERPTEVVRVQASACVNRMTIACCDRRLPERGQEWVAGSTVVDAEGWPVGHPGAGAEDVLATVNLSASRDKRISPRNDVFADRRPELYRHLQLG